MSRLDFPFILVHFNQLPQLLENTLVSFQFVDDNIDHLDDTGLFWLSSKAVLRVHIICYLKFRRTEFHKKFNSLNNDLTLAYREYLCTFSSLLKEIYLTAKSLLNTFIQGQARWDVDALRNKSFQWGNRVGPYWQKSHNPKKYQYKP